MKKILAAFSILLFPMLAYATGNVAIVDKGNKVVVVNLGVSTLTNTAAQTFNSTVTFNKAVTFSSGTKSSSAAITGTGYSNDQKIFTVGGSALSVDYDGDVVVGKQLSVADVEIFQDTITVNTIRAYELWVSTILGNSPINISGRMTVSDGLVSQTDITGSTITATKLLLQSGAGATQMMVQISSGDQKLFEITPASTTFWTDIYTRDGVRIEDAFGGGGLSANATNQWTAAQTFNSTSTFVGKVTVSTLTVNGAFTVTNASSTLRTQNANLDAIAYVKADGTTLKSAASVYELGTTGARIHVSVGADGGGTPVMGIGYYGGLLAAGSTGDTIFARRDGNNFTWVGVNKLATNSKPMARFEVCAGSIATTGAMAGIFIGTNTRGGVFPTPVNGVVIFSTFSDAAGNAEGYIMDSAGNYSQLTDHSVGVSSLSVNGYSNYRMMRSGNVYAGVEEIVNLSAMAEVLQAWAREECKIGADEALIHYKKFTPKETWDVKEQRLKDESVAAIAAWNALSPEDQAVTPCPTIHEKQNKPASLKKLTDKFGE